jgi:aspartate aminotransferase
MKAVADPGDEVIVNRPAWFNYGPIAVEAGLVPIDVALDRATFDIDVAAIEAAITPRTRVVVVNTPHNPTGRIVPVASLRVLAVALERAARREGRPIFILADEVYARIVFDGRESVSPAAVHPHCLIAYSYGKTLLAPGQRLGYLAVAPEASDRDALRRRITALQIATGWSFPDALMQYALPDLERLTIDIPHLQRKRDRLVRSLRAIGYCVEPPEGAFYLLPQSPWPDDLAFAKLLAGHGVLAMPGSLLGMPGHLRLSLTVSDEMIERSLPGFAAAWRDA